MSVQALSAVLDHSKARLGPRLVLIAIANHANENGFNSFPNLETLAREAGLSVRQVIRSVQKLEELGELVVEREFNKPNRYRINLPALTGGAILSRDKSGPEMSREPLRTRERDSYINLYGSGDKSVALADRICEACAKPDFGEALSVVEILRTFLADHVIDECIGWTLSRDMKNKPRTPRYFLAAAKSWALQRGIEVA